MSEREASEQERAQALAARFREVFGDEPQFIARAPGRVNLIGEHTDYNGGFVLPAAIDRTILIAAREAPGAREIDMYSLNYKNRTSFNPARIEKADDRASSWSNYVRGVAWALGDTGLLDPARLPGAQFAIEGNVPTGSGLSSSAAIEVASALAFARLAGVEIDRVELALACQRAENSFVGVKSGIMDQFISALGRPDSALLIDTRSLEYEIVPLGLEEMGYKLVVADSAVPRSLITSAYNERTRECAEAVRTLSPSLGLGEGAQLRDITLDQLQANRELLSDTLYRRARHVIGENERTLEAAALMREGLSQGDHLRRFGDLLYASHASLRDDYEVSSDKLDLLVELAANTPGVAGARMTGAGFGGCTVNIVQASALDDFARAVVAEYRQRTGLDGKMYVCQAVEGGSYLG
ncbi:MAG TPA: galactokinase [Chloroflexia bacterium]|nr:galactokinase [Chloroflexia bacterium]